MAPYSLKNALNLLWVTLKKKRRGFSMAINNDCLQIRARSMPGQSFSLKRGDKAWQVKIHGPRNMLIEIENPSLKALFIELCTAIKEEQWCAEFIPIAESGAEAFAS